jgi:hypothetical protein
MGSLHTILNSVHSYNRYFILAALAFVLFRSYRGWLGQQTYDKTDNAAGAALVGLSHLQLLLGLVMYCYTSAYSRAAMQDFGAAMKNEWLRYFGVEHITMMVAAVVLIQVGRSRSKKAVDDPTKHKRMAVYVTIALLLILASLVPKGLLFGTLASAVSNG